MRDETYCFIDDIKQKKIASTGYHHKVSKTGCKLPSDYLSKKEIINMSSECVSYNPTKLMPFTEFKNLSKPEQEEKLKIWSNFYGITGIRNFARLLDVEYGSFSRYINIVGLNVPHDTLHSGITSNKKAMKEKALKLANAFYSEKEKSLPKPSNNVEVIEDIHEVCPVPFASHKTQFQTEGVFGSADMKALLQGVSLLIREGKEYNLSISFEEK